MEKPLLLPLDYEGEELEFEMKVQQGYVTRVEVTVDGIPLIFEPDNDERYRALQMDQSKKIDPRPLAGHCPAARKLIQAMIYLLLLLPLAAYFLLRRKRKPLPPADHRPLLQSHIAYYQKLSDTYKARFEKAITDFLSDTRIEGVGTQITELDQVLIAAGAVIPIFGFPGWRYQNLTNIILYPDTFDGDFRFEGETRNIQGMVGSGDLNGQMLLSRAALVKGFSSSAGAENTAIHEFTHLLDKSDGAADGLPEQLLAHAYAAPWLQLMHREMHRIGAGHSDINPYALTNEAEFFAVAAEYFFEKPGQLAGKHPELYQQLCRIFQQEPAR